ncbi:MAG: helix-turn-helix domain-containing protein [Cyanobacteria bacterium P01_F01_bin.143]
MNSTWLRDLRNSKEYSQAYIAKRLGISQSQYGRYELEPDDIPYGKMKALGILLGFDPNEIDMSQNVFQGLNLGDPYSNNREYLKILRECTISKAGSLLESQPANPTGIDAPDLDELMSLLKEFDRKPTLAIAGKFDTGKTRLANFLLGGEYLPVKRQPATKYLNIIRHISDAPLYLKDFIYKDNKQVFLLSQDFWNHNNELKYDFTYLDDETKFKDQNKFIKAITLHALGEYGVYFHQRAKRAIFGHTEIDNVHTAVVYIDSPFLLSCNLLDIPGIADQTDLVLDDSRLKPVSELMDSVIYMSQLNGFMDVVDQLTIKYFLNTSIKEIQKADSNTCFNNTFFVCSQVSPAIADDEDITDTLEIGADRLYDSIENSVIPNLRLHKPAGEYSLDDLREQFVTFWAEYMPRNKNLIDKLSKYLKITLPQAYLLQFEEKIADLKERANIQCRKSIEYFEDVIKNLKKAKAELKQIKENEPKRKKEISIKSSEIKLHIMEQKTNSVNYFKNKSDFKLNTSSIESIIREKYSGNKARDEATKNAPLVILSQLEGEAGEICRDRYEKIRPLIVDFLEMTYDEENLSFDNQQPGRVKIPFNFKRLGIDILLGSSAILVSSFISVIFPPLAVPIGMEIAVMGWVFNRQSWQERLAIQIKDKFEKNRYVEKISEGIEQFWDKLEQEFIQTLEQSETQRIDAIKELEKITSTNNTEYIVNNIQRLKELRDFFNEIPSNYLDAKEKIKSL